ncbi:MAG: multicopper oxidase domain-containing protein, partial [Gammaproteobacteria bacterium]|nr:multicopper oxidase domain-containing protein [Gammaproteobacteria bacterium]NIT54462.1 multicopper oxidase domain-containing protein [candidate division Zixibacteria bacterium]NIX59883.1 multicopper oxidase domain-containing protein [candidate division Zixibacteria bacterium]
GKSVPAMTINQGIPGPTLYFNEGDTARIHVHNRMDVSTSIHWHGLLVPFQMDGVPYVSFPPIKAKNTFTYEFPIRQAGTYWYHSHSELQEQSGHYGSIVIFPAEKRFEVAEDHVVLLSDWTNENPHAVLRTLKRGSEWYAVQKGSGQSILGAIKTGMFGHYLKRELQRMPPMDISDVAYDRFFANGEPETRFEAASGTRVRLRIIDGSASSFFHLTYAGGQMTIIAADGQDVEPVEVDRFLIGVAETYDILVDVPAEGAYELRATAHDGSAITSVWLGGGPRHPAPVVPKPNMYYSMGKLIFKRIFALTPQGTMGMTDSKVKAGMFDESGMMGGNMQMGMMHDMGGNDAMMHQMEMEHSDTAAGMDAMHEKTEGARETEQPEADSYNGKRYGYNFLPLSTDISSRDELAVDGMDPRRPWPPYDQLRAVEKTAFPENQPVQEIRLTLDGDMERYVWFINKKALSESDVIPIEEGKAVRFIMINRTMMHHPMHLHGHFFRVVNRHGHYSPLKHTVDVAPMSTTVIEFDANEFGDWFFHCHLLYHLKSGMARVVHYEGLTLPPQLANVRPKLYHDPWYAWADADGMSHMTQGALVLSSTRNIFTAMWQAGWQEADVLEWETQIVWNRYINRFTTFFIGGNFEGVEEEFETNVGILGMRYLLPFNIESMAWIDHEADFRFEVGRELELTPRLMAFGDAEYDTKIEEWEYIVGSSYLISKSFSLVGQWHSDFGIGGGLQLRL